MGENGRFVILIAGSLLPYTQGQMSGSRKRGGWPYLWPEHGPVSLYDDENLLNCFFLFPF
jgi:hypothetical protein